MQKFKMIENSKIQIYKLNIALFLRAMLLLSPVMLLFYQENGLTVSELFFFQGIFYLFSVLLEIPVGYLSDSISKKNVLFLSLFVFFLINLLWLFFNGYYIILAGEILFALSKVTLDNAMSGYLYDFLQSTGNEKDKKMVSKYGHLQFFLSTGTAISGILGTFLYVKFGSKIVILSEMLILIVGMFLVLTLPKFNFSSNKISLHERVEKYFKTTKVILKNPSVMNYIYYSGIFTSFSIMFALSFQPLMKNAFVPVLFFGVVNFINHGIRAVSAFEAGFLSKLFTLKQMIIPLYVLYIIAFLCIFAILKIVNVQIIISLIFMICLIIGFQVLFTIRHVSRLHKFVDSRYRGNIISINNFFSRLTSVFVLIVSKIFIDKFGFEKFYIFMFLLFLIICTTLMFKTHKIEEEI